MRGSLQQVLVVLSLAALSATVQAASPDALATVLWRSFPPAPVSNPGMTPQPINPKQKAASVQEGIGPYVQINYDDGQLNSVNIIVIENPGMAADALLPRESMEKSASKMLQTSTHLKIAGKYNAIFQVMRGEANGKGIAICVTDAHGNPRFSINVGAALNNYANPAETDAWFLKVVNGLPYAELLALK
jgi:hypothetical protein